MDTKTISHLISNAYKVGKIEGRKQVLDLLEKHKLGGVYGFIEQRVKELDTQGDTAERKKE